MRNGNASDKDSGEKTVEEKLRNSRGRLMATATDSMTSGCLVNQTRLSSAREELITVVTARKRILYDPKELYCLLSSC
ncbi:hypothetical protein GWI33_009289 [Rhynchophorus ferrugineus]|uniref:Uncharacterized protein n=1 Tax=Rhynchophorus ferrugineus TaxID=354439 RepID=A0A834IFK5_RHYFE|nr:hypothetical protein GWI33_009289 [Rhynchophorus ferrugineus]